MVYLLGPSDGSLHWEFISASQQIIPFEDIKKELEEEFRELRRACFLSGKCKRKHKDKRFRDAPRIAANDLDISGQANNLNSS